jgi:hypothetical protein
MVTYPITVRRESYRGNDAKKRDKMYQENDLASIMETKINEVLLKQTEPIKTYLWHEVSTITGLSVESVKRLGMSIDGGSGGFTAYRHDLTLEQALAANKTA